jgi:hypothetical protein
VEFLVMKNSKLIEQESRTIVALMMICQDYVIADEEFMSNNKIKRNLENTEFWIELAHALYGAISSYLQEKSSVIDGYDDDVAIPESAVRNYAIDPTNRFEMNDMICDTVDNWIKHSRRNI